MYAHYVYLSFFSVGDNKSRIITKKILFLDTASECVLRYGGPEGGGVSGDAPPPPALLIYQNPIL